MASLYGGVCGTDCLINPADSPLSPKTLPKGLGVATRGGLTFG